jgi:hypothetical protein
MPNIHTMKETKYLKKEDIGAGLLVTISDLQRDNVAMDSQPEEFKYTLHFRELDKPLVLNWTNLTACAEACDSEETENWIGKKVVLYVDNTVMFQGRKVGGIRIRAPKPGSVPADVPHTEPSNEFNDDIPF